LSDEIKWNEATDQACTAQTAITAAGSINTCTITEQIPSEGLSISDAEATTASHTCNSQKTHLSHMTEAVSLPTDRLVTSDL